MLTRIANPELFFGFVAPIGVDIGPSIDLFAQALSHLRYQVKIIKVTDSFHEIKELPNKLIQNPLANRYKSYIQFGNAARKKFKRDEILAALTIGRIFKARELHSDGTPVAKEKVAYLIHQFKRKEEIDLFRSVYGRLFFQVSIYSSRRMRIESLSKNSQMMLEILILINTEAPLKALSV